MLRITLLCSLLLCSQSLGQSVQLPAEIKGATGDFITVAAITDGAEVRWVPLDSGLKLFPVELLKDTRTAVVTASSAGRYRLLAYTAKGDKPSSPTITTVIVGNAPPTPNPNPPAPNPTPPKPPEPAPDPFAKTLQSAYDLERGDTKDGHRLHLIQVYRDGINLSRDTSIQQVFPLLQRLQEQRKKGIDDAQFTQVRFAISEELNKHLPTSTTAPLDDAARKKCQEQFSRIIKILEVLK